MFVYNVVRNQACLARLRDEIDDVVRYSDSEVVSIAKINAMPYLSACIRESLRHDPSIVSYLPRQIDTDGVEVQGRWIPKGTEIGASPYAISHDRNLYGEDVDVFRPERYLEDPEWAAKVARHEFIFGYGPRNCIGKYLSNIVLAKAIVEVSSFVITTGIVIHRRPSHFVKCWI